MRLGLLVRFWIKVWVKVDLLVFRFLDRYRRFFVLRIMLMLLVSCCVVFLLVSFIIRKGEFSFCRLVIWFVILFGCGLIF